MGVKIEYNDNLNCLCEFIRSATEKIYFKDLLQFAIDYDSYKELYLNQNILIELMREKNEIIKKAKMEDKKDLL